MITLLIEKLYFMPFLVGIIFVVTSLITYKFPPKKINYLYGYRTQASMKNQEVWNFSQRFSSIKMLQTGLFLLVFSLLGFIIKVNENTQVIIGVFVIILTCIFIFYATEKAIKKNFPKN